MNEREFTTKIKESLNFGLGRLDADISQRLETARKQAMEAFVPAPAHASTLQWAGGHGGRSHGKHHPMRWLSLLVLLAALGGTYYWQQVAQQDDDDVDAALLGDDLPVKAYLDHGFQEWLDRTSQR